MLSNMKTVKMMGYTNYIANAIQAARMSELAASKTFRKCMTVINSIVIIPKQLSAPFTFMVFVLAVQHGREAGGLTASRAFTSLTIIELITTPLGLALQTISSVTSSLACLDRIQAYLKSPNKVDQHGTSNSVSDEKSGMAVVGEKMILEGGSFGTDKMSCITLRDASFAYQPAQELVLNSISLTIPRGSITMVVGPVGSGKSALLKAFLNELDLQSGELDVRASRTAYCDSNPWIPSGSVRDCIVGMSESDETWFNEVVHACAFDEDIHALADGAETKIGSRGIALSEGQRQRLCLARAIFSRAPLMLLDDVFRSLDSSTESIIAQRLLSPEGLIRRYGLTAVLTTHSARCLSSANQVVVLKGGHITQIGSFEHLSQEEGYVRSLTVQQQSTEIKVSTSPPKDGSRGKMRNALATRNSEKQAKRVVGTRDKSVYKFYLRPIGMFRCMVLLFAVISLAVATRFQLPATAGGLHEQLLTSIINAPLSYFTTTDAGVILNRFSQDMAIINGMLPVNIFQAVSIFMICLIQIAFIAYGSKYLSAAIPLTLFAVWLLSRFYLLTSQQLRLLDIELKAPIYTSLAETKEGLATIRAFGWQSSYKTTFQARIDESKRATYLLFMIQRWLNFVLDLIIAGLATILMTLATQLRSSTNAAMLGVGLSSLIGFSMNVSQFIVCYTELENSLGAISRTKDCVDNIEAEDSSSSTKEPPPNWPSDGNIEFHSVTASYNDPSNPALKNITFTAPAGHKLLICGRTGSGKSTILSLLLRLLTPQKGSILIDSIDISTIPSQTLRNHINVIPQSPFLLPGSVRLNLQVNAISNPPDNSLILALQKVNLWSLISARGGLDAETTTLSLSHGQKQLFALAAAVLRKSTTKIVVVDEAASGVDTETARMMMRVVGEEFAGCTVLC
ncbi:hypothetical protein BLS_000905, partial [Venturia inaequalis]